MPNEQLDLFTARPAPTASAALWPDSPMVCKRCAFFGAPTDLVLATPAMAWVHAEQHRLAEADRA